MKVAYIAGPYSGKDNLEIEGNIHRARVVAAELWRMGYAVFCPHSNSAFFDGIVDDEVFYKGDIEILSRCDICVLLPGWMRSKGAVCEYNYCLSNKIPIFYWPDDKEKLEAEA